MSMTLTVREHVIRVQIIEVVGRLEAFTVGDLRAEQTRLIANEEKHFVVDLSQTQFMDSAGMSALVSLLKQARQAGGDVVLVRPLKAEAQRILTLTRFDQVFKMAETAAQAISLF
jgi:anti-anti-sigma factor